MALIDTLRHEERSDNEEEGSQAVVMIETEPYFQNEMSWSCEESSGQTEMPLGILLAPLTPITEQIYENDQRISSQPESTKITSRYNLWQIVWKRSIQFPEISPQLLEKLERERKIGDCFERILNAIKRELLWHPETTSLRVEDLNDPEGEELRIYFVITTNILSRKGRRALRNHITRTIDEVVQEFVKSRDTKSQAFVQLRVVFGVIIEGPST
ncbi:MAG: hypothetical protein K9W43_04860 [Candidatus Thorarchaeota archaeon]|nr:hypothetical protein [Candidatus Thorarchaeota archaeon]